MEGHYESANRKGTLKAGISEYIKTPSETKVVDNSFCIVFSILISKTIIFTYEIKHLNPLTETLLLSITTNTIFHTLHEKCSELQHTHPFLTYSCNTNNEKQKKKTR
jgi:hypothetical protein